MTLPTDKNVVKTVHNVTGKYCWINRNSYKGTLDMASPTGNFRALMKWLD